MGSQANDLAKEIEMNLKLRTAIAALIAALSVAVTIDASPANAALGSMSASLTIEPYGASYYKVYVEAVVRTSSQAEASQLYNSGYRFAWRLWGDDPVSDDLISEVFHYDGGSYYARPDGLYYYKRLDVPKSWLNEDQSWTDNRDEIYAGVRLLNTSVSTYVNVRTAETNRVSGYF
jgi:hypothetical protein